MRFCGKQQTLRTEGIFGNNNIQLFAYTVATCTVYMYIDIVQCKVKFITKTDSETPPCMF